jgi:hypothetical protein
MDGLEKNLVIEDTGKASNNVRLMAASRFVRIVKYPKYLAIICPLVNV